MATPRKPKKQIDMHEAIATFENDPLGFVYFAFPWGEEGTALAKEEGPDTWQIELLEYLSTRLKTVSVDQAVTETILLAIESGHGSGKTAVAVWVVLWLISTHPDPQIVVTANTQAQLEKKTWRELAYWHKLCRHSDWFSWTATKFYLNGHADTWFASAITWNEEKPEAFAGTHAEWVLVIFDESSNIPDVIWETVEGAMFTGKIVIWIALGNPTRPTGRFIDCFEHDNRWKTWTIDVRNTKKSNKKYINELVERYGEDHDIVRVRVRGVKPRAGLRQFIGEGLVLRAEALHGATPDSAYRYDPLVFGLDVARGGGDATVLVIRQGIYMHPTIYEWDIENTVDLAALVSDKIARLKPAAVFIDAVAVGWGLYSTLIKMLPHVNLFAAQGSEKAVERKECANRRAEMWLRTKEWLEHGGVIPAHKELHEELISVEMAVNEKSDRWQVDTKGDIKAKIGRSPDYADALALTFYMDIYIKSDEDESLNTGSLSYLRGDYDWSKVYNDFAYERSN